MPNIRTYRQGFGGGEVCPEMLGRIDDAKTQSGLLTCRNFVIKPQGTAENRSGTRFVRAAKYADKKTKLIPFRYSSTQTAALEFGEQYIRFHSGGATLLQGSPAAWVTATIYAVGSLVSHSGTNYYCVTAHTSGTFATDLAAGKWYAQPATGEYEVPSPYLEAHLFALHYVQSNDVLTLVHPLYAPRELRRYGATDWRLVEISFLPPVSAPTLVSSETSDVDSDPSHRYSQYYVVTAIAPDLISESEQSEPTSVVTNLYESGVHVTVSWASSPGAVRYNVYKQVGGMYGWIGQTANTSMVDDNIEADMSRTPPIYDTSFVVNGIYSVPVTDGGADYNTAIGNGAITGIGIIEAGLGYAGTDTIALTDPTGSGATFSLSVSGIGEIEDVDILTAGVGYSNPTVNITTSTGSGALLTVAHDPPLPYVTLAVTDATGSGAELAAVVDGGEIKSIVVVKTGSGYTAPVVTVDFAAGGSGATFGTPVLTGPSYPGAVTYYEQRRCFGGTNVYPSSLWMTRSGTESNMSYSLPLQDSDRISARVAAREANQIRHMVPLSDLMLLTDSVEWRVTSVNSEALTPSSISVKPQSHIGANNVQPAIVNNTLLYCAARGGHVREAAYNWQSGGYISGDLSLRATHLFDNKEIVDLAYAQAPVPIAWFVNDEGSLLGLTYIPEQQVGAWHRHDTDGLFESCASVVEGNEDVLYLSVSRQIDGETVRYIEVTASRQFDGLEDAVFLDCALTYDGAETSTITGLDHLEGKVVGILCDGSEHAQQTVTGGEVSLDVPASKVHVGLPIVADLETLPIATPIDGGYAQGRTKAVNKIWLRLYRSSGLWAGPDSGHLRELKQRTSELYGTPPDLLSEEVELMLYPSWAEDGRVFIRQESPTPLTLVSLTAEVSIGG